MSTKNIGKRKAADDEPASSKKARISPTSVARFTRGDVIKILVGPEKAEFVVHKSLFIEQSPFFAAKAKPCWKEAELGVDLKDVDVEGFEIVVDWMYRKELLAIPPIISYKDGSKGVAFEDFHKTIRRAYRTADQLLMTHLQDQLIEHMKRVLKRDDVVLTLAAVAYAFEEGLCHTPWYEFALKGAVRSLMTGKHAIQLSQGRFAGITEHKTAMKDLLLGSYHQKPWKEPIESTDCEFHIHVDQDECPLRMVATS